LPLSVYVSVMKFLTFPTEFEQIGALIGDGLPKS
jgi:hypothetical protein